MKYKKCKFLQDKVEYLGHEVSNQGIKRTLTNTNKILTMPEPSNSDEVRSFLGTIGYYRRFSSNILT